jgi:uncharacterized protein
MATRMKKNLRSSTSTPPKFWSNDFIASEARSILECDCDCGDCVCDACSDPAHPEQRGIDLRQIVQKIRSGDIDTLAYNTDGFYAPHREHWVAMPAASSQLVVMEEQVGRRLAKLSQQKQVHINTYFSLLGNCSGDYFEKAVAFLISQGVLISPQHPETHPALAAANTLSTWIQLTNQCNLQCQYCYVPRDSQSMTVEIAQKTVQAIFRSAQANVFSRVKLKYSGGEPTLNFKALLAAQFEAEKLRSQTGIALDAVMLTNGFHLTDQQIDLLLEHKIRVMVSVDGLQASHDLNRPAVNRDVSSFAHAAQTMDRLLERGLAPHISITLTRLNLSAVPEWVEKILEKNLTCSLNFYRPVPDSTQAALLACKPEDLIKGMLDIYTAIEQHLPPYSIFASLADRANPARAHQFACGAGQQYMVVDCQGLIAKCQMEIGQQVTSISAADPLERIRSSQEGVQNTSVDSKECGMCPWRYRCAGGCPRVAYQQSGNYASRSPLCEVYQQILPAAIRLEADRLLRYHQPVNFSEIC